MRILQLTCPCSRTNQKWKSGFKVTRWVSGLMGLSCIADAHSRAVAQREAIGYVGQSWVTPDAGPPAQRDGSRETGTACVGAAMVQWPQRTAEGA